MSDRADKAAIARLLQAISGTCRVCECHGDSCALPEGERCCWVDELRTLCSNPACLLEAGKLKRKRFWEARRARR